MANTAQTVFRLIADAVKAQGVDLWDVVFVERGNDFSLKQYDNVVEACLDFLDRMADTGNEGRLKNRFLEMLINIA